MNKKIFKITSIRNSDDYSFWKDKSYLERIEGIKVNFISLKDLKTNKKASGRYRDLDDLEHLKKIIK